MIGSIPVVKFKETAAQTELENHLYHQCMDIILHTMKQAAEVAVEMADSHGDLRRVRTVLFLQITDLVEERMVAGMRQNYSPISIATIWEFGDGIQHFPRHGSQTIKRMEALMKCFGEDDVGPAFLDACQVEGLNGVLKPFWRNWRFADPCIFLTPDALHQWHKAFQDHIFKWGKELLGPLEMDRRLSCLQKRVGFRHFPMGVTGFKQHTGRESCDLERTFLAVISGHSAVTPGRMQAFRAFLDFVYLAQYESHDEDTLKYLRTAIGKFWNNIHTPSHLRQGPNMGGGILDPQT